MTTPPVDPSYQKFCDSYRVADQYPAKLLYRTTYASALQIYHNRLIVSARRLCVQQDSDVRIGTRDFWNIPGRKGGFPFALLVVRRIH